LKGPVFSDKFKGYGGKGYVSFNNSFSDTIEWSVHVGVGDVYGLRFKYINPNHKDIVATVMVINDDGIELSKGTVYFSPSSITWDKVNIITATSINAGHYRIRLVTENAEGLLMDNLKVN